MKRIHKISLASPIDYAAEELKKYIRMMSPEGGDVKIDYAPEATDGWRLGLMQDFGLEVSDAKDVGLDDVIFIKADARGGIIAGTNPRSVLIAVYEFLRRNGCRWLFPGVDGEYIPTRELRPVEYRHKASARYRGNCIEGAIEQRMLLDYIEFLPKVGLNTFMIQFRNPSEFYIRYYSHESNRNNFPSETVTKAQTLAWTRAIECEMDRRGIMLHSVGHGWTVDPFGIDSSDAWRRIDESAVPEESRQYLAMLDGERRLWNNQPINTQICMSNPVAREKIAKYIAEYAESHFNVDYLHVWLADATNNHCECEECQKKIPSDWYVMLLNEIDAALTERGLSTRIVFIAYTDTMWAPLVEKFNSYDRFTLMIAPISRDYTRTLEGTDKNITVRPYARNRAVYAKGLEEFMYYFKEWKRVWPGASFVFEYHFWRYHHFDVSGLRLAERIYEDNKAYAENGFDGVIECGSQRSFFPNGLAFYTHARSLFDYSLGFDEIRNDYYTHAYGEASGEILEYLNELESAMPYSWLALYNVKGITSAERANDVTRVKKIVENGREIIKKYYDSDERVQTVSIRILEKHAEGVLLLSEMLYERAIGNHEAAERKRLEWVEMIGGYEPEIRTYFEHWQGVQMMGQVLKRSLAVEETLAQTTEDATV